MLEQVLGHLRNWFVAPDGIRRGEFTVEGGTIVLPSLQNGQYFRIIGSVFNDGVYQYPVSGLTDETFTGAVWALSVPRALLDLVVEIETWCEKNETAAAGPYQSESFGGYAYTLKSGEFTTWQGAFRLRLNRWRKL